MDPITPCITFLGVLVSQFLNKRMQIASDQTRALQQVEQDEQNRDLQLYLQEQRHEHEKEIDKYRSELRKQEEYGKAILAKGGLVSLPGEWLRSTFPGEDGPFVFFETHLEQGHEGQNKLPFNPLQFLVEEFKSQCQNSTANIKVASIHERFTSEAEVRSFIIREFPTHPVVIVYGSFTGIHLSFHVVFNGLSAEQLVIDPSAKGIIQTVPHPDSHSLGRFSSSLFSQVATRRGRTQTDENSQLFSNTHDYEASEFIFDFAVNTSLHALIDQYMAFFPNIPYEPQATRMVKDKSERLRRLGLWSDELNTFQDLHAQTFLQTRDTIAKFSDQQKQFVDHKEDWK